MSLGFVWIECHPKDDDCMNKFTTNDPLEAYCVASRKYHAALKMQVLANKYTRS